MRRTISFIFVFLLIACAAFSAPKNVIYLIGDGMGIAHVHAARIAKGGSGSRLAMDSMPITGLVTTYSADSLVTDSAAAGTALATGIKTNNGTISLSPDGQSAKSILEAARDLGKSTGIVTTKAITDATPAVFASHVEDRGLQNEIAGQLVAARVDVLLGGGRAFFLPKSAEGSEREDEIDLLDEAKVTGYTVVSTAGELSEAHSQKLLGLFALGNLTTQEPEPPLSQLAAKAIETLSVNKNGFFVMIEGGQIDSYAHGNDLDGMVRQLLEFDRAIAWSLEFAKKHGDTLVIVTTDHETGGLTLLTDENGKFSPSWSTGDHSASPVLIYAYGPGSSNFSGVMDNTDVSKKIADLWGAKIGLGLSQIDHETTGGFHDLGAASCRY